jgi:plasmid stabilization system protein ParE
LSGPLPIVVSRLAAEQIRVANDWWRANRPKAPNAFSDDLAQTTALLALQPRLGARARNAALAGVRRVHLTRIRYDLYYRIIEEPQPSIEILALRHSSRGGQPTL